MYALILLALGPWVDDPNFPRPVQEKALLATMMLRNTTTNGQGTAVRVMHLKNGHSYFLTAAHNLTNTKLVNLAGFAPPNLQVPVRQILDANVVHVWPNEDLALIKAIETDPAPYCPIVPPGQVPDAIGLPILTIGCENAQPPGIVIDRVKAKLLVRKPDQSRAWHWQTEKVPPIGRSGGPCFDKSGRVIGICSGTQGTQGFYVHTDEIHKVLDANVYSFLWKVN